MRRSSRDRRRARALHADPASRHPRGTGREPVPLCVDLSGVGGRRTRSQRRGGQGGTGGTPMAARPAAYPNCPPLSPCAACWGGQRRPSGDAVSHLVPLRCNGMSAQTAATPCPTCPTASPCLRASAGRAGRHERQAASGRSRAIGWRCRRETGRRARSVLPGATGSRLVLARWQCATSTAGVRRASRTPEAHIETKRFGEACEAALWSGEHRQLRRVPLWPLARTPAGIDQIVM